MIVKRVGIENIRSNKYIMYYLMVILINGDVVSTNNFCTFEEAQKKAREALMENTVFVCENQIFNSNKIVKIMIKQSE